MRIPGKTTALLSGVLLAALVIPNPAHAGAAPAAPVPVDAMTVDSVTATSLSVPVKLYVRDASGTALNVNGAAGAKIQGIAFQVTWSPAASITNAAIAATGLTASLTPIFPATVVTDVPNARVSYLVVYSETGNTIPFTLDQTPPGDEVATITFTLAGTVTPGQVITLTLHALDSVDGTTLKTFLSNQGGTTSETVANFNLALTNGQINTGTVPVELSRFEAE